MLKLLPKLAVLATIGVLALPGNEHQRNLVVQGIVQAYNIYRTATVDTHALVRAELAEALTGEAEVAA